MTDELTEQRARSFSFGRFVLIPERQLLLEGEAPVRIGGRALEVLTALVERSGELVDKRELMARVWPDTAVVESNLKVNVAALRRTLGDGSSAARYIATVTGRGYRFVAPVKQGYGNDLAPARSAPPAHRHNLPIGTTQVLGRVGVIDTICSDLETSRIVTIVGPGGVGKTTVALAVAEQALGSFEDGVWLVDFALLKDPALASNAIATAIGLGGDARDMLGAVCESLRGRELLLVLDSCEHIVEVAASCVSRILAEAAGVRILVTSREPLLVKGERVRRLPGLETPPPFPAIKAEIALEFPAVQLFVERATERYESFELDDVEAPQVAEICRRLDGLALAIELAATRIDAFGIAGLLEQLDHGFRALVGHRAPAERHRTLTATLDWSYGLLSQADAALLRALSVFAGVFDIESASAVSGLAPAVTAAAVADLAAKSLLAVDLDGDDVAYRLLETTRGYCLAKREIIGEDDALRRRHAEHVCKVLERGTFAYRGVLDDLRSALAWAARHPGSEALLVRLTLAGIALWNHFSLNDECRVHTSRAIAQLDAAGLAGTAAEMRLQESLAGAIICTLGLLPQATVAATRALGIAVRDDDTDYHMRCLRIIGLNQLIGGELTSGMRTLGTFIALATAKEPSAVPAGEVHLAIGEFFVGELDGARRRVEGLKLRYAKDADNAYFARFLWSIEVVGGMVLSNVQWLNGFPDTGVRTALAAVEAARNTGHELSVSNALAWTCPIFFWNGHYDECHRRVTLLDEKAKRHGIIAWRPLIRFFRGALACRMESARTSGIDEIRDALAEFRAMNHMVRYPYYTSVLAEELASAGRLDEAEETSAAALAAAESQHERWCVPELLRVRASVLLARGRRDDAESLLLTSLAVAVEIGAASWRLRSAIALTALWRDTARADEGRKVLHHALRHFTEGFGTHDLVTAANLVARL